MHSRVVRPEVTRLPLSGGDWVEVKRELNAGEYFDLMVAVSDRKPFAKLLAYLVGWSLVDLDDRTIPISVAVADEDRRAAVRSLDKGTLRELIAVIDKHEAAEEAALEAKKNALNISSGSNRTFASVG